MHDHAYGPSTLSPSRHWDVTIESGDQSAITMLTCRSDLGLSAGKHLEPALQPGQRVLILLGKLGGDAWPGIGGEDLDPLIVTGEAIVGDQPFVDHAGLQTEVVRSQDSNSSTNGSINMG
jgi:hypothetical protein